MIQDATLSDLSTTAIIKAGKDVPEAKEALSDFCKKTIDFIVHCSSKRSTQANESQNSLIAREADKNINYGPSYPARVAVAVGKKKTIQIILLRTFSKKQEYTKHWIAKCKMAYRTAGKTNPI